MINTLRMALGALAIACMLTGSAQAAGDDEISLFDGHGGVAAYVAIDDGMTIYLWSGKPVAYLDRDGNGGFHIYGFNGQHLGWFLNGIVWDHDGKATCATKERMRVTEFESFKSFKQFKPFKSFKEFAPFRPTLVQAWAPVPCRLLLAQGAM